MKRVLRTAGDTSITVGLKSENAVQPVEVSYSEIQKLERQGMGWGVKVAIVAGIVFIAGAVINSEQCASGC